MSKLLIDNLGPILAGIVIPGLVISIFMALRFAQGHYTSGLDAIAGLSGLDFGLIGLANVFRRSLSLPFREPAELIFVTLGLLGILIFALLLPMERALSRYDTYKIVSGDPIATERGYTMQVARFPSVRFFLSWVSALSITALNVLLFFIKAGE